MSTRVMVMGGAGFIGSALTRLLVGEVGLTVLNVDKLTYAANIESLSDVAGHPRYSFAQIDIADVTEVRALFRDFQPDIIMHLASIDSPGNFIKTNILGTFVLLEQALDYWRGLDSRRRNSFLFHHVSTDEVFGAWRH